MKDKLLPKTLEFILNNRFCDKHMREFIKKSKIKKKDYIKMSVVKIAGLCSKCGKMGIVFYLENEK